MVQTVVYCFTELPYAVLTAVPRTVGSPDQHTVLDTEHWQHTGYLTWSLNANNRILWRRDRKDL